MSHANAALTPHTRLRLALLVVEQGWTCPTQTSPETVRRIVGLRWRHRLGPVHIAGLLCMAASTVHAVLVRCRINRLSHIDRINRITGRRLGLRPALRLN